MTSFFDSGPLPDFKEIQKWLGKDLPWKLVEQWDRANDNDWLNAYVRGLVEKSKQQEGEPGKRLLRVETSKEEKHVVVTLAIPEQTALQDVRLFATADRLKVTGLPSDRKQIVRFPCLVVPKSGRAGWKNDKLTVRFRRRPLERDEVELFIGF